MADDPPDVLPRVLLTPAVVRAWQETARHAVEQLVAAGQIAVDDIPDEQGYIDDDNYLVVYCDLPGGRVSRRFAPGQWAWANVG